MIHDPGALFMPLWCQSTVCVLRGVAGLWLWSAGPTSFSGSREYPLHWGSPEPSGAWLRRCRASFRAVASEPVLLVASN